eukprot:983480-Rhodomonas_salina.5
MRCPVLSLDVLLPGLADLASENGRKERVIIIIWAFVMCYEMSGTDLVRGRYVPTLGAMGCQSLREGMVVLVAGIRASDTDRATHYQPEP